jgi:hypothetical protein
MTAQPITVAEVHADLLLPDFYYMDIVTRGEKVYIQADVSKVRYRNHVHIV